MKTDRTYPVVLSRGERTTVIRVWGTGVLLSFFSWTVAANDVVVAHPGYRLGDAWTYERTDKLRLDKTQPERSRYTAEVVRVSDGEVEVRGPGLRWIVTPEGNFLQRNTVKFEPLILWRRFPLKPGDTWKSRYEYQVPGSTLMRTHSQLSGEVEGWETVTVPAGTFRCLKITARIDSLGMYTGGAFSGEATRTECWSPEVKSFVRMEYQSFWVQRASEHYVLELVEFRPGR